MKKMYLLSIVVATALFTGCGSESDDDSDGSVVHNQGQACLLCHNIGGTNEEQFASGATIFTKIDAADNDVANVATGYSLRLMLDGNVSTSTYVAARGIGNYKLVNGSAIVNYTAQVLDANGTVTNTSVTNSHNASRFDCNSCHTVAGANGAPGRITAVPTPVAPVPTTTPTVVPTTTPTFAANVLPILTASCAGCHGASGNFSITNSVTPYAGVTPFVTTTNATASALLQKGAGVVLHGGGNVLGGVTSTSYITIRDWITAGALNN